MLKRLIILTTCFHAAVAAACAPVGGRWETTDSGCQVWNDEPHRDQTITWSGKCERGKATGRGLYIRWHVENGKRVETRYEGRMIDGDMSGHGTLRLANGDGYQGGFSDGLKNGTGTYRWANGDSYTGEFREDKMHGNGVFKWADGSRYQGEFRDGELVGAGFDWVSGAVGCKPEKGKPPGTRRAQQPAPPRPCK